MKVVLDTHAALWLATEDRSLGRRGRALASAALRRGELCVSAVSFWEIAMLIAKGRLDATRTPEELRASILHAGLEELPLTGDIAIAAASLDVHGDPADRFIAATAVAHAAVLVTADERLLAWRHPPLKRQDARR